MNKKLLQIFQSFFFFIVLIGMSQSVLSQVFNDKCATHYLDSIKRATIPNAPSITDFENWLAPKIIQQQQQSQLQRGTVYTIPVVVHVIHNGDAVGSSENIPAAQVYSQIDILNEDFRRLNDDTTATQSIFLPVAADSEIEFCLAQIDPSGNIMAEAGINRVNAGEPSWPNTSNIDGILKPSTIWDPNKYFNIWTVNFGGGGLLGYAQFPEGSGLAGMPGGAQNAQTDGIVCRYSAFGRVGNLGAQDRGRTATHEAGHWLGLRHIWGDGGCSVDDYCNDTPVSNASNYGCQIGTVSCNSTDMIQNYMDYSDDDCMNLFTEDQKARMRTVVLNSPRRVNLLNSQVCQILPQRVVTGQVRDATTLIGIPNAKVRLKSTLNYDYSTTCNATGNFSITVFEGTYNVYGGQWSYITEDAPNIVVNANTQPIIIDVNKGYYDDFVLDFNWNKTSTATTGDWVREEPLATNYNGAPCNAGSDVTNDYGGDAYVTGNAGGSAGTDDVDNGVVTLTSPTFNLSGFTQPKIKYYRWFYNGGGSGTVNPDDNLTIQLSNGNTTVVVDYLDLNSPNSNQWNYNEFFVSDFLAPTANMTFSLTTSDLTNGHLVEAGIDLFRVTDTLISTNLPPIANFVANTTTICVGESVIFSDLSSNSPTSWSWNFTGGTPNSSAIQNPTVNYNTPGTYPVSLTATNQYGNDTETKTAYITVENISAVFSASETQACPGTTIQFTDQSTCNPTSWVWTFQGGVPFIAITQNPSVTYANTGTYNVTLQAANTNGTNTTTQTGYITITTGGAIVVFAEDFESNSFNTNGWTIDNPDNSITWEITTVGGTISGSKAARVNLYNYTNLGQRDGLISPVINLSAIDNATLSFDHALRRKSSSQSDSLIIYVSTNGGATYPNIVFARAEDGTGTLGTDAIIGNVNFVPNTTSDWCYAGGLGATCFTVDLSAFDGYSDTRIKFETFNDLGNNLYIDNIELSGTCTVPLQLPVANFTSNITSGCEGYTINFTDQSTNNPTSWTWSFPGGTPNISNQQNPSIIYNTPGTYDVSLTVLNNDGSDQITETSYITVFANPNIVISSTNVSCFGGTDGFTTVTASGSTPFTYNWSNGSNSQTLNGLPAGTYTVTVTDVNGCTSSDFVVVQEPLDIVLTISSQPEYCANGNGSAEVLVNGGTSPYIYSWSNGGNNSIISSLTAGNYIVTITDANGCEATTNVNVSSQNSNIGSSISISNVICFGGNNGAVSVTGTNGLVPYTFNWSTGQSGGVITNLSSGVYGYTITDANGCSTNSSVFISQPGQIQINAIVNNAVCGSSNGNITIQASAGQSPYSYLWQDNSTASIISNLTAGTYSVTVTDNNSCTNSASYNVSNINGPSAIINSSPTSCYGGADGDATVTVSGGTTPYTYLWSNGRSDSFVANLSATTYTVTVNDNNGCVAIQSVQVLQPSELITVFNSNDASCGMATGSASVQVSGGTPGYTYNWNTGSITDSIQMNLAGTYTVSVSDANNCFIVDSVAIADASGPSITITIVNPTCFGSGDGAASVIVGGGTSPYTYNWSNGQSSAIASNLSIGTYTLTLTDANGCVGQQVFSITDPTPIVVTPVVQNATCGGRDGSISTSVVGGNAPYSYLWSTGQISSTVSTLSSGTYELTVTDVHNCYSITTINISNIGGPTVSLSTQNISCNGFNDGLIVASVSGGATPYTYDWSNGANSASLSNAIVGNYALTVTDSNGCESIVNTNITEPTALQYNIDKRDVPCYGKAGSATAYVNGGNMPYTYNWSNGVVDSVNFLLTIGDYYLTITDDNGCLAYDTVTIIVLPELTLSSNAISDTAGQGVGSATVNVSDGVMPYTYVWNNGESTHTITGLTAGAYTVTVSDSNSCQGILTIIVDDFVSIGSISNGYFNIYPNPTIGMVFIETKGIKTDKIEVFNSLGNRLNNIPTFNSNDIIPIDLSAYPNGIYFIRIIAGKEIITRKISLATF